jgi:hypothetical protein
MGPGHFDYAVAGAAQGRIYANNNLPAGRRRAEAALKNGLGGASGAAQARLELFKLTGCDGHGGRNGGGVESCVFRPELKTKSASLANYSGCALI